MLRELQQIVSTPANAMFSAGEALVTGMGVVKTEATKTVSTPTAETVADVVLVNKERIPQGMYAAFTDLSDYHDQFCKIESGEMVKFKSYHAGDRFATDQFVATGLAVGVALSVNTDGKWAKAANTLASKYIYKGTMDDCGHTLAIIEVTDTPIKNA